MPTNRRRGEVVNFLDRLSVMQVESGSLRGSSLTWLAGLLAISCLLVGLFSSEKITFSQAHSASLPENWFYLRDRQPVAEREQPVEVLVVGDVMLGRGVASRLDALDHVSRTLVAADLAVGNFEGVLSTGEEEVSTPETGEPIRLLIPPEKISALQSAGFDLLSLANNHSLDLGLDGLKHTAQALENAGVRFIGAGISQEAAFQPLITEVRGVRLAFLSVDAVPEPASSLSDSGDGVWQIARWNWPRMKDSLAKARQSANGVIVLVHWGDEYERNASPAQREAAKQLIDSGADVVIGSHPHAVQQTAVTAPSGLGDGQRQPGFVAYSLGNFVFDQFGEPTDQGLALRLYFDRRGLRAVSPLPVAAGPSPKFLEGDAVSSVLDHARPTPEMLAFRCTKQACLPIQTQEQMQSDIFSAGEIDLTGDGRPEQVRLQDRRVTIFENGRLVWESPREWEVLDTALGDPNNDGRAEVVLALRKPDQNGLMQSHPFLIGFRGGIYRQVWGGSAVAYPILEIETADLDGDGFQELVVLEDRTDGRRAITVWRWNSWVFSQFWSSEEGNYSILNLYALPDGTADILTSLDWAP